MTGSPSGAPRLLWPDVAKGACILLVVLHHITSKHYVDLMLVPEHLGWFANLWLGITDVLRPIRMPLFFLISGYFAARVVARPWASIARRIAGSYYLYVVWLVLFTYVYAVEQLLPANRTQTPDEFLGDLVFPATSMWFLYALAAYVVLAKVLLRFPHWGVVAAAGVLCVSASGLPLDETNRISVLSHFVFFVVGAYYPGLVSSLAARRLPLVRMLGLYLAVAACLALLGAPRSVDLGVLSILGIPIGITAAVLLAERSRWATLLSWLGRRTLGIYVLHLIVLGVVVHLPLTLGAGHSPGSWLVSATYPAVATLVIAGACLAVRAGLERVGFGFLFAMPRLGSLSAPGSAVRSERTAA